MFRGGKGILIQDEKVGTLSTLNNQSVCYGISAYESNAMKSANPYSGIYEADTARTLDLNGGSPACNQGGVCVCQKEEPECYGLDRASFNQGQNAKYDFAVEKEKAQPIVARGPGGVLAKLSEASVQEITKE